MASHLWILALVLLISISTNSCSGTCTNVHHHVLAITLPLTAPDTNLDLHIATLYFDLFPCLELPVNKCSTTSLPACSIRTATPRPAQKRH